MVTSAAIICAVVTGQWIYQCTAYIDILYPATRSQLRCFAFGTDPMLSLFKCLNHCDMTKVTLYTLNFIYSCTITWAMVQIKYQGVIQLI